MAKEKPKDWRTELRGSDRDAAAALTKMFKEYGLGSLADNIVSYIREGYSADTVTILLQDSPEYKKRFAGNEARKKAGLAVLSPAEYLATEASYKQIMQQAGLPPTFYDSEDDFAGWIGNDVSPTEVQSRVKSAQTLIESADPSVKAQFAKYYTDGDMVAYALDRKRTAEILDRQVRASQIGAAAKQGGLNINAGLAEQVAGLGIEEGAARQGVATASQYNQNLGMLASAAGEEYGQDDAVKDVFLNDTEAGNTRRRLASQERGRFSGSTGINETTLSRARGGQD